MTKTRENDPPSAGERKEIIMEEKVIVKSTPSALLGTLARCFAVPVVVLIVTIVFYYAYALPQVQQHMYTLNISLPLFLVSTLIFDSTATRSIAISVFVYFGIVALIWGIVNFLKNKDNALTVTNKRIYGRSSFGKQVDLPLNSISSVSSSGKTTLHFLTSSGKVSFGNVENSDEIFQIVSKMLVERQG